MLELPVSDLTDAWSVHLTGSISKNTLSDPGSGTSYKYCMFAECGTEYNYLDLHSYYQDCPPRF